MNNRYIIPAVLLILLSATLVVLPKKNKIKELEPHKLLHSINDETRFLSAENIAEAIISQDPSFQLIDVRKAEDFAKYNLQGSINIPLEKLFEKDQDSALVWESYLNQKLKKNVFYSNGTIYANQAWVLCRRLGFENNYVLKDGLNGWFANIIQPSEPTLSADTKEIELYEFRKAASRYFTGASTENNNSQNTEPKQPVKIKKMNKQTEGGC